jgi:hypothetical protein
MDFLPFVPFERAKQSTERRRYRIESFVNGSWVVVANKNGKLEDAVTHCANSYSNPVRIFDIVLGKYVYERESNREND